MVLSQTGGFSQTIFFLASILVGFFQKAMFLQSILKQLFRTKKKKYSKQSNADMNSPQVQTEDKNVHQLYEHDV